MKKLTARIGLMILTAALIALFAGCGDVETVAGTWRSGDGVTLTLTDEGDTSAPGGCFGSLTLTGTDGESLLPGDSLPYTWQGDEISVTVDGSAYTLFTTELNDDDLILNYSEEYFGGGEKPAGKIILVRAD